MQFLSDNAASVHPAVWAAMRDADAADSPYDTDRISAELDDRFAQVFNREVTVLWVATGTAANCLALSALCPPHGGVICHREAHIEMDEGGAPGFYLHGAKLLLADGDHAKLAPEAIADLVGRIRNPHDVHQVHPHAISITQASEYGCVYTPGELAKIDMVAGEHGLKLHMDGARFANAVIHVGRPAAEVAGPVDALSFGFTKNGGMNAEAIVFFEPALADTIRFRRKRAGHLQSKGRFLSAQLLAMLGGDVWLHNAEAANAAARAIAEDAGERLLHPVQANEVFLACTAAEREALRAQGFAFYDWGRDAARFVASWDSREDHARALGRAIAGL
ncbi:threonine aldolase family protein [Tsuneonella sp. HG222]